MSRTAIEMHRLQELIRLHRMGSGKREVARLLGMSPNTERQYREALEKVGLLEGPVIEIPELGTVRAALRGVLPSKRAPQQISSIEKWTEANAGW